MENSGEPLADGLIVGSALVRVIEQAPAGADIPALVAAKIRELRDGMDGKACDFFC